MEQIIRPLEVIESEINFYKNQTATGMIEIGKRLIEVKEQLPHGEWLKWIKEKVEFSERTARQFMRVAEEFGDSENGKRFPISKLYALLDVPADQREEFIKSNPIDEMTTRQLQDAIQEKKKLEQQLEEERNKPPKEVAPPDYNLLKSRIEIKDQKINDLTKQIEILELKANANEKDAEELARLRADIRTLTKERTDIGRQIRSATELSGLVAEVQMFFRGKLAPVKYSRAIQEAVEDDTVRQNLTEILDVFGGWIDEMKRYTYPTPYMMSSAEIIEMEVNENE